MPFGLNRDWIFFIINKALGLCYYRDMAGNVQSISILAAGINIDVTANTPDGWMNQQLGFMRSGEQRGYGFNRSFSLPQKLIDDAAYIVRTLYWGGRGIEVPLTMAIFKYNDSPAMGEATYEPYYSGLIELPKSTDIHAEGFSCNLMEGGAMQWLKAIEDVTQEIECDGSIPEDIKLDMDGMLFEDTLDYNIVPMELNRDGPGTLGVVFINEEGDSGGITHNDPQREPIATSPYSTTFFQNSPNWIMNSQNQITVEVSGEITVASDNSSGQITFALWLGTSKTTFPGVGMPVVGMVNPSASTISPILLNSQQVFTFDAFITLSSLENLYVMMTNIASTGNLKVIGGFLKLKFASKYLDTAPWAMTLYDYIKKLVENGTAALSTTEAPVNLSLESQLLKNNLNLCVTSGDALRASGDPDYQKFYNVPQLNPNFPNLVVKSSYGPVLRGTLADAFKAVNALLCASMSSQILPGENETLFIESRGYVFDKSVVNMDNGEVSEFRTQPALDLYFTLLRIGYEPPMTDQKQGKYAFNTKAEWVTQFKSIPSKPFEIICPYIAEPYLIEKVRANISDTSTTRNNHDASVFLINRDTTNFIYDQFSANFTSLLTDITNVGNTNILLKPKYNFQSLPLPLIKGSYLSNSNSTSIFLFNQAALSGTSMPLALNLTGNLFGNLANLFTGLPADTATFKLFINGAVVQTFTFTVTGPVTPFVINFTLTRAWSFKDSVYLTCSTSVNGSVDNVSGSLKIGTGGAYLTAPMSNASVDSGVPTQLMDFDTPTAFIDVNGEPVISWGFQYFFFNSILINSNFNLQFSANGEINGGTPGNTIAVDVWFNGVSIDTATFTVGGAPTPFTMGSFLVNKTLQLGDIIFMTGSAQNTNPYFFNAQFLATSTQIQAWKLKRVQYDAIYGLPALLGNMPGTSIPITTGPGAPYNIEDLTPLRMLMNWKAWFASLFFDQIPGIFQFSTSSKNQSLSTSKDGVVFTESADIEYSAFGMPLFIPRWMFFKTRVQETFFNIMTGAANAYVMQTFLGVPVPGFPWDMKQKPALNESQEWKMLMSPDVNRALLTNMNDSGLTYQNMLPNSIFCSFLQGIQFVPAGQVLPAKYHTKSRNLFWFIEQVANWINQNNYWQPWQMADMLPLQFITRDLSQVQINVYSCSNSVTPVLTAAMTNTLSPSITAPYFLWQISLDLSGLPAGGYFITAVAGTGAGTATLISEGILLQPDWPETSLIEAKSSVNKQDMIFDTGFIIVMRFFGFFDNRFKQKYKGAFYVDQGQNIRILNGMPYEITTLWCGGTEGQPDYVTKKISRLLILDGCVIEGEGFVINEGDEWSEVFKQGAPKKFQEIVIRPTDNTNGISATAAGADTSATAIVLIDASALGPNAGNAGGPDPDLTSIIIS